MNLRQPGAGNSEDNAVGMLHNSDLPTLVHYREFPSTEGGQGNLDKLKQRGNRHCLCSGMPRTFTEKFAWTTYPNQIKNTEVG